MYSPLYTRKITQLQEVHSSNIFLLGNIPQEELHKYYLLCDFVVVPSIAKEGLPKVVFEALIMGKPVIASDRGGITEFIHDNHNGVIIKDPVCKESIKTAILGSIKAQENLKKSALSNIYNVRSQLSAQSMAENFDKAFNELLENNES
jgi:UDP-N-acetylglucosamine:(glucosyl)LPS alpha-1,2-N-acetylglucosaminyltransferase